jgi:ABC-type multidrug transport system ATPase subunit
VNAVFDALDKDENGVLDYDELNHVLQMDYSELQEFVRRMNATERGSTAATHVSRKSFCRNFLAVLEQVSNFQMTREEAGSRWDAMADVFGADANNELDPEHLYESTIADFLDDVQISDLIKGLRREKATELLTAPVQDPTRPQDRYRRKNSRVKSVFGPSRTKGIDRNLFCEHFPKLLEETLVKGLNRDRHAIKNQGIDIAFQNLQLSVVLGHGKSTNVVDKVSGRMKRGTMTAVIGGSGCGKTSLLNALCGRAYYGEVNGTIYINGNPACIDDFRDSVGFVPQDDIVFAELTVRENLMYSGRFRLPRKTPFNEVEELANRVMANLGLIRKAQCVVGDVNRRGISGGEKKRVSIGLELMARPTALFLDEPTSGLDASSALLVMTSLKQLVQNEGATICSVIHQPRKFIFYLFDSLILLGVGGRTVYHGPVDEAESYFEQLNYRLPIGESLSDFLIDISTGRIEPCTEKGPEAAINAESIREMSYRITQVVNPSAKKRDEEDDDAKMRVHRLFDYWDAHTSGIKDFERSELSAPEPYDMPEHFVAPSFFRQFQWQLQRMFLVAWRNRISKAWDTAIIVLAFAFITFFDGTVTPTTEKTPLIPFEVLVSNQSEVHEQFFPSLFEFAVNSTVGYLRYGIHIGIISAVLVALTAVKNVTEKRLENFREVSSGINVTAYFVALNVFTTIEQGLQVMLGAVIAQWLRHSIANKATFYAAFLVLTWITLSWTLLIPLIVPPKNTILALGFFMGFFGLMFGGASPPVEYPEIYKEGNAAIALVSAFFSPTRFFKETLIVSDQKCLPPQTGFTQAEDTYNFPQHLDSFSLIQMGQLDSSVNTPSCSGWYWGILPAVLVGFTVRFAALGCVNCLNRSQQAKKSFWFQLRHQGSVRLYASTALFCICLVVLVVLTSWTVLRSV